MNPFANITKQTYFILGKYYLRRAHDTVAVTIIST